MTQLILKKNTLSGIFFAIVVTLYYYQVRIVGAIGIGEIAMILWLFVFLFQNGLRIYISEAPTIRLLFIFTLLWMIGALYADIYNSVAIVNTVKLFFSIGILFLLIVFLTQRVKESPTQTIIIFFIAISLSIYFGIIYTKMAVYKAFLLTQTYETLVSKHFPYAIFNGVITFVGLTWYFRFKKTAFLLSFLSIFLFLYLGSRSVSLVFIGSTSILIYYFMRVNLQNNNASFLKSLSYFFIFLMTAFILVISVYKLITIPDAETNRKYANNFFSIEKVTGKLRDIVIPKGSVVREKSKWSKIDEIPIYWDRRRFFQGVFGITQKPLGYGSKYDPNDYSIIQDANNFFGIPSQKTTEYAPNHSHIVGAALHSGLLALPFWLFMIYINCRLVLYNYADTFSNKFMMFVVPLSFSNIWSIFFSPFSERISLAFTVAIYILFMANTRRKKN